MYCMKYNQSLGVIPPFDLRICILILVRVNSNLVMIMLKSVLYSKEVQKHFGNLFFDFSVHVLYYTFSYYYSKNK